MARKSRTKPRFILRTLEDSVELLDQSLVAAYLDTNYWVDWTSETCTNIRIGSDQDLFIQALGDSNLNTFAIITAYNPGSRILSDEENQQHHAALHAWLKKSTGLIFPSIHISADGKWPPEPGFLVAGISPTFALQTAHIFAQNAIVWWSKGNTVALWWC